jgi:hypothetical protein
MSAMGQRGPFKEADISDGQIVQTYRPAHQWNDGNWDVFILYNVNLRMALWYYAVPTAPELIMAEKWRCLPSLIA